MSLKFFLLSLCFVTLAHGKPASGVDLKKLGLGVGNVFDKSNQDPINKTISEDKKMESSDKNVKQERTQFIASGNHYSPKMLQLGFKFLSLKPNDNIISPYSLFSLLIEAGYMTSGTTQKQIYDFLDLSETQVKPIKWLDINLKTNSDDKKSVTHRRCWSKKQCLLSQCLKKKSNNILVYQSKKGISFKIQKSYAKT